MPKNRIERCQHLEDVVISEVDDMGLEFCQCLLCGRELQRALGSEGRWRLSKLGLFYPTKREGPWLPRTT